MGDSGQDMPAAQADRLTIRRANAADLAQIVALDQRVTGIAKADYWDDVFDRYATRRLDQRFFLVAENGSGAASAHIVGYIVGEVRAWEFGSEPCGWVFALSVDPDTRLQGIGERLFAEIAGLCRGAGVRLMRTMVSRENRLPMAFFRGEGMRAGPYIQLEMELDA